MTVVENTKGAGGLAAVAWTPLEGTGLDSAQQASVDQDVASAQQVARALLAAANSAINDGRGAFTLNDLAGWGLLVALPNGAASAEQWAAYISGALGTAVSADSLDDLNGWRRVASDMQRYAARQASKLDPSGGAERGGGITHANGQWYANGMPLSLLDLFTAVRVNRLVDIDETIGGYLDELRENQQRLNAARSWEGVLRSKRPADNDQTAALTLADVEAFKQQWGLDPIQLFTPSAGPYLGSGQKSTQWDTWLTDLKSYVDRTDTDNQTLQTQIDQKNNRRSEVFDQMTSFAAAEAKTGSLMASSLE